MLRRTQRLLLPTCLVLVAFGWLFLTNNPLPLALGQTASTTSELPPTQSTLLETPIFKQSDQPTVTLSPTFSDESTNIAFYMKCPSVACPDEGTPEAPVYIFSAENLGRGALPFSEYWEPPVFTDYIAIEYKNDAQQFTCSDKSVTECQNDPHFISIFEFALVSDTTDITPEMLASKNIRATIASQMSSDPLSLAELSISLSAPSITSDLANGQIVTAILDYKSPDLNPEPGTIDTTASDALTKLSVDLSAVSITSDLANGQIVTAVLDNKPSPLPEPEPVEETSSDGSVGGFIMSIVDSIIDVFTPDSPPPAEPTTDETPVTSDAEAEPTTNETPVTSEEVAEPAQNEAPVTSSEENVTMAPEPAADTPAPPHENPSATTE